MCIKGCFSLCGLKFFKDGTCKFYGFVILCFCCWNYFRLWIHRENRKVVRSPFSSFLDLPALPILYSVLFFFKTNKGKCCLNQDKIADGCCNSSLLKLFTGNPTNFTTPWRWHNFWGWNGMHFRKTWCYEISKVFFCHFHALKCFYLKSTNKNCSCASAFTNWRNFIFWDAFEARKTIYSLERYKKRWPFCCNFILISWHWVSMLEFISSSLLSGEKSVLNKNVRFSSRILNSFWFSTWRSQSVSAEYLAACKKNV